MEEATVLHALRVLRGWILPVYQTMIQHINVLAGRSLAHYQIKGWMLRGKGTLHFAAAYGLVHDLQNLPEWLKTPMS